MGEKLKREITIQIAADSTLKSDLNTVVIALATVYQVLSSHDCDDLKDIENRIYELVGELENVTINQYEPGEEEFYAKANRGNI